jgi:preprotein translocase subunit YajC
VTPALLFAMAPAPGSGSGGFSILIMQVVAIGLVFYFLIIRPQGQARKKHEELLAGLKKGDEITTSGGLIGKVKDIKDDRVMVESGSATVVVERARIVRVGQANAPSQAG